MHKQHLIIDTDGGADDLLALMLALTSSSLTVDLIIAGYGAFPVEEVIYRISKVMQIVGKQVPIIRGLAKPLKRPFEHSYLIHGKKFSTGNWRGKSTIIAFEEISTVLDNYNTYVYVSLGALTNLANVLKIPISSRITNIVMMGGVLNFPGNVTPFAEANLYHDPEADIDVFLSKIPIYLFPLNITEKMMLTKDMLQKLRWSGFIREFWQSYEDFYVKTKKGFTDPVTFKSLPYYGAPMHDALPIVFLLNPDIFKVEQVGISLDFVIKMRGLIVPLLRDYPQDHDQSVSKIFCASDLDKIAFFKTIHDALNNYEKP